MSLNETQVPYILLLIIDRDNTSMSYKLCMLSIKIFHNTVQSYIYISHREMVNSTAKVTTPTVQEVPFPDRHPLLARVFQVRNRIHIRMHVFALNLQRAACSRNYEHAYSLLIDIRLKQK